jgi:hypothetical protein
MSRKLVVICDLCEEEPAAEHAFGLDDSGWKMDLCDPCAGELRTAMDRWIQLAARTKGTSRQRKPTPGGNPAAERVRTSPEDRAAIRAWATEEAIDIPRTGQIPRSVWKSWQNAGCPRPTVDVA